MTRMATRIKTFIQPSEANAILKPDTGHPLSTQETQSCFFDTIWLLQSPFQSLRFSWSAPRNERLSLQPFLMRSNWSSKECKSVNRVLFAGICGIRVFQMPPEQR